MRRFSGRSTLGRMKTKQPRKSETKRVARSRAEWRAEVRSWQRSGQPAEQYASEHDLSKGTLLWWSCQLRKEQGVRPAGRRRSAKAKAAFLPVKVREAPVEPDEGSLEVVLANGRRVRICGRFDAERVGQLLAVVEGGAAC